MIVLFSIFLIVFFSPSFISLKVNKNNALKVYEGGSDDVIAVYCLLEIDSKSIFKVQCKYS